MEQEYIYSVGIDVDCWGIPFSVIHEQHDDGYEILSIQFLCFYLSVEIKEVSQ